MCDLGAYLCARPNAIALISLSGRPTNKMKEKYVTTFIPVTGNQKIKNQWLKQNK